MEELKFTVITVTYNCEDSIEETIKSVINQTYKNIEYLIIDGKSNDNTIKIIKKYMKLDDRIRLISEKDNGIYDAMNKGIINSSGYIINFLNSADKYIEHNAIENIVKIFLSNLSIDILYCNIINGDKIIKYKKGITPISFIRRKSICHQAMFIKKDVFEITGLYDLKYKIVSDRDWFIKCYKKNLNINHFNKEYIFFDNTGISSNGSMTNLINDEMREIIINNFGIKLWLIKRILDFRH